MRPSSLLLGLLFVTACNSSCSSCEGPGAASSGAASAASLTHPPSNLVRHDIKTTSPAIALGNLSGDVKGARRQVATAPKDVAARGRLVQALTTHARVVSDWDEFAEGVDLGLKATADFPDNDVALGIRRKTLASAHRFKEALAELDRFDAAHPDNARSLATRSERGAILLSLGRYDEAAPLLLAEASDFGSITNLDLAGLVLARMGKVTEAEQKFVEAEAAFRNVSPFPLVDLYFDRGSLWETQGDLDKARELFFEGHDKLPEHVHVATHLAALLTPAQGVAVLEPVCKDTKDPDAMAALGVERNLVAKGSGDADIALARARYDNLMAKLPEAFANHAGWFWLGPGDNPKKAFAAASKNLEARETAEAFELFLRAATRAGEHDAACGGLARAKSFAYPTKKLTDQMKLVTGCPDTPSSPPTASAAPSAFAAPSASAAPVAPSASAGLRALPSGGTPPRPNPPKN